MNEKNVNYVLFYAKSVKTSINTEEIIDFSAIKIKNNEVINFFQIFIKSENKYNAENFLKSGVEEKILLEFGYEKSKALEKINDFISSDDVLINFGFSKNNLNLLKKEMKKSINTFFLEKNLIININKILKNLLNENTITLNNLSLKFHQKNKFTKNIFSNIILLSKIWISFLYLMKKSNINLLEEQNWEIKNSEINLFLTKLQIENFVKNFDKNIKSLGFKNNLMKYRISLRWKMENKIDLTLKKNQKNIVSNILESQEFSIDDLIEKKKIEDSVEFAIENLQKQEKLKNIKKNQPKTKKTDIFKWSKIRKQKFKKTK